MEFPNLCIKGDMSGCKGSSWKTQIGCLFSEKASKEERCMYFVMGEFCDCLKAQMHEETPLADKVETKPMEEIIKDLKDSAETKPKNVVTDYEVFRMPVIVGS